MNLHTKFGQRRRAAFAQAGAVWLMLCLAAGGALIGKGLMPPTASKTTAPIAAHQSISATVQWKHAAIDQVHVGQRVVTPNTVPGVTMATAVDPSTWKMLNLVIDIPPQDDAPEDVAEIQTIQSPAWIEQNQAKLGAFVPTPLDLREMGIKQQSAQVVSIDVCPRIKQGPGRVVLTTVNHLNQFLFDLTVVDGSGHREVIGVTGWHKIYSESRSSWVSTLTVTAGERLRGHDGSVSVESLIRRPGTFRVYNMTVEDEHVYYVSDLDALCHNNDCTEALLKLRSLSLAAQQGLAKDVQRSLLRDALQALPGKIAHHIIPLEAETEFGDLLAKAAKGGFDINGVSNGILLGAADHVGGHPLYNKAVLQAIGQIPENLSPKETANLLQKAADTLRRSIVAGTFGPWGSNDGSDNPARRICS